VDNSVTDFGQIHSMGSKVRGFNFGMCFPPKFSAHPADETISDPKKVGRSKNDIMDQLYDHGEHSGA